MTEAMKLAGRIITRRTKVDTAGKRNKHGRPEGSLDLPISGRFQSLGMVLQHLLPDCSVKKEGNGGRRKEGRVSEAAGTLVAVWGPFSAKEQARGETISGQSPINTHYP